MIPYSGSIVEDAARKEDQARLNRCNSILKSLPDNHIEDNITIILDFLHDTWSVIRTSCAKILTADISLSDDAIDKLAEQLCLSCYIKDSSWQSIHGSLLGLNSLVSRIDIRKLDKLTNLCLDLIGHIRNPIRDASRTCLLSIQKKRISKSILIDQIVIKINSILDDSNESEKESVVLILDGNIGCLVDNYQQFPSLLLHLEAISEIDFKKQDNDNNNEIKRSPCHNTQHRRRVDSSIAVVNTMKKCMLHSASSVRQKAGQVITIILLKFINNPISDMDDISESMHSVTISPTNNSKESIANKKQQQQNIRMQLVDHIISHVLVSAIESSSFDNWRIQEISLMVAEELIKEFIKKEEERFNVIIDNDYIVSSKNLSPIASITKADSTDTADQSGITGRKSIEAIRDFLSVVKNNIPLLISHQKFEVRRMILQLLPYLARALIMMDISSREHIEIIINNKSNNNSQRNSFNSNHNSNHNSNRNSGKYIIDGNLARSGDEYLAPMSEALIDAREHGIIPTAGPVDTINIITDNDGNDSTLTTPRKNSTTTHKRASRTVSLDLDLLSHMVWLGEIIKETQHLFEVFTVRDNWETHNAIKLIHMKSFSRDDHLTLLSESSFRNAPLGTLSTISNTFGVDSAIPSQCASFELSPDKLSSYDQAKLILIGESDSDDDSVINNNNISYDSDHTNNNNDKTKSPLTINNNTLTNIFPRGVVDNWSLDGRGRLMEIESRLAFHKFIKKIYTSESIIAIKNLIIILIDNCKNILVMISNIISQLEIIFIRNNNINNNTEEMILSTDFIEVFALIKVFLLGVKCRFQQSLELKEYLAMVQHELIDVADLLEKRHDKIMYEWIGRLTQVQLLAGSSSNTTSKSKVKGLSNNRATSTQLLVQFIDAGFVPAAVHKSHHHRSSYSDHKVTSFAPVKLVASLCKVSMLSSEKKETSPLSTNDYIDASAMRPMLVGNGELISFALIPSLTDAGTNPIIYQEHQSNRLAGYKSIPLTPNNTKLNDTTTADPIMNFLNSSMGSRGQNNLQSALCSAAGSPIAMPKSPEKTTSDAFATTLDSVTTGGESAASSPSKSIISSTTELISGSAGAKNSSKSQLMDRWNCEAVSPVLFCLANAVTDERAALCLAAVSIEWILSAMLNPLWLDNRYGARKNMFDALVVLLSTAAEKRSPISGGVSNASVMFFLVMRVVRAITESLSLRMLPNTTSTKSTVFKESPLDLKCVLCLVRSVLLGLTAAVRYYLPLKHRIDSKYGPNSPGRNREHSNSFSDNTKSAAAKIFGEEENYIDETFMEGWEYIHRVEIQPIVSHCIEALEEAIVFYKKQFPYREPDLSKHQQPGFGVTAPTMTMNKSAPSPPQYDTTLLNKNGLAPLASVGSISEKNQKSVNFSLMPPPPPPTPSSRSDMASPFSSSPGNSPFSPNNTPVTTSGIPLPPSIKRNNSNNDGGISFTKRAIINASNSFSNGSNSINNIITVSTCESNETVKEINNEDDIDDNDSDEFSDWDEEEEDDENEIIITDSTANLHTALLTAHLWTDMDQLSKQLEIWQTYMK